METNTWNIGIGATIAITYILGYFSTLIFLSFWGKRLGFDYDQPDKDWDDWEDNASAYTGISFAWPMLLIFGTFMGMFALLRMFSQLLIDTKTRNGRNHIGH